MTDRQIVVLAEAYRKDATTENRVAFWRAAADRGIDMNVISDNSVLVLAIILSSGHVSPDAVSRLFPIIERAESAADLEWQADCAQAELDARYDADLRFARRLFGDIPSDALDASNAAHDRLVAEIRGRFVRRTP